MRHYGLFGWAVRERDTVFWSKEETEEGMKRASKAYKKMHLEGNWIAGLWSLQPVFLMCDTGDWDAECKSHMDDLVSDSEGLDGFTLLLYGGSYSTDKSSIEKLVSSDVYFRRLHNRLSDTRVRTH